MIALEIIKDGFWAAIAGIGFGAISHPPRRAFLFIAILAAVGHALRFGLMNYLQVDIATASFCAAVLIGFGSLWFGKMSYCPMTVLYIPALLPMIPGMFAYKSVLAWVRLIQNIGTPEIGKYMQDLITNGIVTISVVFLLAVGATLPILLFQNKAYSMTRRKI